MSEPEPETPAAPQSDSELLAEMRDLLVQILAAVERLDTVGPA